MSAGARASASRRLWWCCQASASTRAFVDPTDDLLAQAMRTTEEGGGEGGSGGERLRGRGAVGVSPALASSPIILPRFPPRDQRAPMRHAKSR